MASAFLTRKEHAAQLLEGAGVISYAPEEGLKREKNHAGSPRFHEDLLGTGAGGNAVPGRSVGAGASPGREENHQGNDRKCRGHCGCADRRRLQGNDAREPERSGQGLRRNSYAAHSEFRGTRAHFQSCRIWNEVRDGKAADENIGGTEDLVKRRAEKSRRPGICVGARAGGTGSDEKGLLCRADRNVSGAVEEI